MSFCSFAVNFPSKKIVADFPLTVFVILPCIDLFPQLHKITLACKYISFLWNFMRFLSTHLSSLLWCPRMAAHPVLPVLYTFCKLAKGAFIINEDILLY